MKRREWNKAIANKRLLLVGGAMVLLVSMACRFNIREIGFAEIAPNPYVLYYFYDGQTKKSEIVQFEKMAEKVFQYSNVKSKTVNILDKEDPVLNYLSENKDRKFPTTLLLSPDGTTVEMPVPKNGSSIEGLLRSIVSSSFRSNIKSMLVRKYAVVLLLTGMNDKENEVASSFAKKDVNELEKIMPRMPKLIKEGPELVVLSRAEMEQETSLLWSLGIDAAKVEQPIAVIIYGRGRIMGDVIPYNEIQTNSIFKLLNIIGADCECGLDRKWMLGKLIPMTWDPHLRTELYGLLKFDVENPMILSEMSQIISIEATKSGSNTEDLELFQPKEYSLSEDVSSAIPSVDHISTRKDTESEVNYDSKLMSSGLYAILGLVLVVLVAAIFLIVKKRRQ